LLPNNVRGIVKWSM